MTNCPLHLGIPRIKKKISWFHISRRTQTLPESIMGLWNSDFLFYIQNWFWRTIIDSNKLHWEMIYEPSPATLEPIWNQPTQFCMIALPLGMSIILKWSPIFTLLDLMQEIFIFFYWVNIQTSLWSRNLMSHRDDKTLNDWKNFINSVYQ